MSVSVFFMYLSGYIYWAVVLDTVGGERVGGVGGFVHLLANLAGVVGPMVTGFIVQATGAYTSAFVVAGAIAVLGALFVRACFVAAPHPSPSDDKAELNHASRPTSHRT